MSRARNTQYFLNLVTLVFLHFYFFTFSWGRLPVSILGLRHLLPVIEFKKQPHPPSPLSPCAVPWADYEFWLSHSFGPRLSSVPPSPVNLFSCLFVRLSLVSHHLPLIPLSCALSVLPPHLLCTRQRPRGK